MMKCIENGVSELWTSVQIDILLRLAEILWAGYIKYQKIIFKIRQTSGNATHAFAIWTQEHEKLILLLYIWYLVLSFAVIPAAAQRHVFILYILTEEFVIKHAHMGFCCCIFDIWLVWCVHLLLVLLSCYCHDKSRTKNIVTSCNVFFVSKGIGSLE